MRVYQYGDTVFITCLHQTYSFATDAWTTANADTGFPKITIINSAGTTKVDATSMDSAATGKFTYQYEIPASPETGRWTGYVDTENDGHPDRQPFVFQVS